MEQNFNRFDLAYLNMAKIWSDLSYGKRLKVGAILVKDRMIISDGYNGTPNGMDNVCEDENNQTHWYVLHAENNALLKCLKSGVSTDGATLYVTHSCCKECSKLIYQAGIQRVVYIEEYRDLEGINFLKDRGIQVQQINILEHEK